MWAGGDKEMNAPGPLKQVVARLGYCFSNPGHKRLQAICMASA